MKHFCKVLLLLLIMIPLAVSMTACTSGELVGIEWGTRLPRTAYYTDEGQQLEQDITNCTIIIKRKLQAATTTPIKAGMYTYLPLSSTGITSTYVTITYTENGKTFTLQERITISERAAP